MNQRQKDVINGNLPFDFLSINEQAELCFSKLEDIFMIKYPDYELVDIYYPYVFIEKGVFNGNEKENI